MILTPHSHPRRRIYYQSKKMTIFQGEGKKEKKRKTTTTTTTTV
jgi:hypothetical protein